MDVFLPVAGMPVNVFVIVGLGGTVGLLSGLFGVGGGFLLTPLLMMIGIPPAVAVASDTNQIVAASVSGTLAHSRQGNVDFKLGFIILAGGLLGGSYGTILVNFLRGIGNFEFAVRVAYVIMLFGVGSFMFYESLGALRRKAPVEEERSPGAVGRFLERLPMQMYFDVARLNCSVITLFALGFLIGILAALMGVGGGFIMLPVMIYLIGMPTHVAVGTSIFTVIFTAMNVTIAQGIVNHTVDVILALLLLIGSAVGAQIGAKIGRRLRGEQ
ncbi:MAG: sulfite exporter TauE/SafE family protein, partial [Firmicutes bacterium]|nr:sulfite exporter TauE/SafE family protein [Bacillota bacterium]